MLISKALEFNRIQKPQHPQTIPFVNTRFWCSMDQNSKLVQFRATRCNLLSFLLRTLYRPFAFKSSMLKRLGFYINNYDWPMQHYMLFTRNCEIFSKLDDHVVWLHFLIIQRAIKKRSNCNQKPKAKLPKFFTLWHCTQHKFPITTDHAAAFVNIPLSTYQKAFRKKCIVKSHNNLTLQYFHMYQPSNVKEA